MTFAAGSVTVAAGRVSSADYADDTVRVIVSDGCALKLYVYDAADRVKTGGTVISYSDDCALVPGGRIERREGLTYVAS